MPFPWTLQRYIFREMSKAFVLAAIALTALLGLGGGVMNMVRLGEVTPQQLFQLMALLLPLAAALTLPIAALFGAAATYGRLSADNEFVACRSSGINLYVLFLPTLVLSLVSAALSFGLTNFVIPGMVRNLESLVKADIGVLAQQRLNRPSGMSLGRNHRLTADESRIDPDDPSRIHLERVTFVEMDQEQWARFGTAKELSLQFERLENRIRVSGWMRGLSFFDRKQGQFVEEAWQAIPTNEFESPVAREIKFLNLGELLHYLAAPGEWFEVRDEIERLRQAVGGRMVYDDLWARWIDDRTLTLSDARGQYIFRSQQPGGRIPRDGSIELTDVTIEASTDGRRRLIEAERAILEITRGATIAECGIGIELRNARVSDGTIVIPRDKYMLGPVSLAQEWIARAESLTEEELLRAPDGPDDPLEERRAPVREARAETVRRIVGAINERVAFSTSVFVLVILAAALGIIFRGAHVMTAFGISFIPTLVVLVAIMMGRQMAQNASTHLSGLLLMWAGIVAVAVLDVWTMTRVLRR
jgi:lipopolysaccharide export LptBFGC system permease protein LptF